MPQQKQGVRLPLLLEGLSVSRCVLPPLRSSETCREESSVGGDDAIFHISESDNPQIRTPWGASLLFLAHGSLYFHNCEYPCPNGFDLGKSQVTRAGRFPSGEYVCVFP